MDAHVIERLFKAVRCKCIVYCCVNCDSLAMMISKICDHVYEGCQIKRHTKA